jgi:hypothetical protein
MSKLIPDDASADADAQREISQKVSNLNSLFELAAYTSSFWFLERMEMVGTSKMMVEQAVERHPTTLRGAVQKQSLKVTGVQEDTGEHQFGRYLLAVLAVAFKTFGGVAAGGMGQQMFNMVNKFCSEVTGNPDWLSSKDNLLNQFIGHLSRAFADISSSRFEEAVVRENLLNAASYLSQNEDIDRTLRVDLQPLPTEAPIAAPLTLSETEKELDAGGITGRIERAEAAAEREAGHILKAAVIPDYSEEFVGMHEGTPKQQDRRRAGLKGIIEAVGVHLKRAGVGIAVRIANIFIKSENVEDALGVIRQEFSDNIPVQLALKASIELHKEWNLANAGAELDLTAGERVVIVEEVREKLGEKIKEISLRKKEERVREIILVGGDIELKGLEGLRAEGTGVRIRGNQVYTIETNEKVRIISCKGAEVKELLSAMYGSSRAMEFVGFSDEKLRRVVFSQEEYSKTPDYFPSMVIPISSMALEEARRREQLYKLVKGHIEVVMAKTIAARKEIIHDLNDLGEGEDIVSKFIECLEENEKIENRRLAIRGEAVEAIIKKVGEEGFKAFMKMMQEAGMEIYVRTERAKWERYRVLGLTGNITEEGGVTRVSNRQGEEREGTEISNFKTLEDFREKIRGARGSILLVSNRSLRKLTASLRSAVEIRETINVLKGWGIMEIFMGREIEEERVRETLINVEAGEKVIIEEKEKQELAAVLRGEIGEAREEELIGEILERNKSGVLNSAYKNLMEDIKKVKEAKKREKLKRELFKVMTAKIVILNTREINGRGEIMNKANERMLMSFAAKHPEETAEVILTRIGDREKEIIIDGYTREKTAGEVERGLEEAAMKLKSEGKTKEAFILLLLLSLDSVKKNNDTLNPQINIEAVKSILKAA